VNDTDYRLVRHQHDLIGLIGEIMEQNSIRLSDDLKPGGRDGTVVLETMYNGEEIRLGIDVGSVKYPVKFGEAEYRRTESNVKRHKDRLIKQSLADVGQHTIFCQPITSGSYVCTDCSKQLEYTEEIDRPKRKEWVYGHFLTLDCNTKDSSLRINSIL